MNTWTDPDGKKWGIVEGGRCRGCAFDRQGTFKITENCLAVGKSCFPKINGGEHEHGHYYVELKEEDHESKRGLDQILPRVTNTLYLSSLSGPPGEIAHLKELRELDAARIKELEAALERISAIPVPEGHIIQMPCKACKKRVKIAKKARGKVR